MQVGSHLLSNAAKYTSHGGVIADGLGIEDGRAVLSICDNGVGIEPDMLEQIFDMFIQAERTPDRSQGGLGIGLALVRPRATARRRSARGKWGSPPGQQVPRRTATPGRRAGFDRHLVKPADIPQLLDILAGSGE